LAIWAIWVKIPGKNTQMAPLSPLAIWDGGLEDPYGGSVKACSR
jgi:hypothetical protein